MKLSIDKKRERRVVQGVSLTPLQKEKARAVAQHYSVNVSEAVRAMIDQAYDSLPPRARTLDKKKGAK